MSEHDRPVASFTNLLDVTDCEDETELSELLTEHVDPRGVTGHIIDVVRDDVWMLRVPGQRATVISFPTSVAWVKLAAEDLLRSALEQAAENAASAVDRPEISDPTVLEAASWRLASALTRRHPRRLRLIRAHPASGQADCLWLLPLGDGGGDLRLNRTGSIDLLERFDRAPIIDHGHTPWSNYIAAEHHRFIQRLEQQAGLAAPDRTPAATPVTLTLQVLAALTTIGFKSRRHVEIQSGYIDTSGSGTGPNEQAFAAFPHISPNLQRPQRGDLYDQPGYRFWFVLRSDAPVLAVEQSHALAWTRRHQEPVSLTDLYASTGRDATVTALAVLQRASQKR